MGCCKVCCKSVAKVAEFATEWVERPACCKNSEVVAKPATKFETLRDAEIQMVADFVTKKLVLQNFRTTSEFRRIRHENLGLVSC